jgi:DNA-directed RNA polymerase subunit L
MNASLESLNRILLILDGARRASHIENSINLNVERESHIMANQLKLRVIQKMGNVLLASCAKIISDYNFVAQFEQSIRQVGAKKARSSSYQNPHPLNLSQYLQIQFSIAARDQK